MEEGGEEAGNGRVEEEFGKTRMQIIGIPHINPARQKTNKNRHVLRKWWVRKDERKCGARVETRTKIGELRILAGRMLTSI